ncbi:unnamed protein product, partial [Rotaria magnacalcarata]
MLDIGRDVNRYGAQRVDSRLCVIVG